MITVEGAAKVGVAASSKDIAAVATYIGVLMEEPFVERDRREAATTARIIHT